jgi:hypothetical protein
MLTAYALDSSKRLVSVRFAKKLTIHDIEDYAAKLRRDSLFNPDFSEGADLREVREVELDAGQALQLADEVDPFSSTSKRAFVTQGPEQTQAARMHLLLRLGNNNVRILETIEAALEWIEN